MSQPFPGPLEFHRVVLQRFRVTGVLAQGGQCVVYAAEDEVGHPLALKVARTDTADPHLDTRLEREGELLARLDHPHIVTLVASGRDPESGLWCLVMERLPGVPLARVVERSERVEPATVAALVEQIASALAAIHALNHVMRDLTPAQVMARPGEQSPHAVLLDLGLAREAGGQTGLTDPACVAGTPGFVAPEALDAVAPTPAADVYSLAALAYALLAGNPPFAGLSAEACLAAQYAGSVPALPRLPGLSRRAHEAVEELLRRALSPQPEERPSTPEELARGLVDAVENVDSWWRRWWCGRGG